MKIRNQQIETFSDAAARDFEDRMVLHVRECFPEECKTLGETKTRKTIREGVEQAAEHQIVVEHDVCRYISLMFAYGRKFATDRDLPWADDVLSDETIESPRARVDRLYEAALEHEREGAGDDGQE